MCIRDSDKADPIVDKLLQVSYETFPQVLTNQRPNIVMIILESFTADVVASLGGDKRTDPNLEKMISEGIFFDSIYSSGTRTDQGIVSVLNGWPATPYHSIMRSSEKSMRLPSLPVVLSTNAPMLPIRCVASLALLWARAGARLLLRRWVACEVARMCASCSTPWAAMRKPLRDRPFAARAWD